MSTVPRVKIELGEVDPSTRFVAVRRMLYGSVPEHWRRRHVLHPRPFVDEWVELNHGSADTVLLERWGSSNKPLSTLVVRLPDWWADVPWAVGEERTFTFGTPTGSAPRGSVRIARMEDYEA